MDSEKTAHVPELDSSNYAFWYLGLKTYTATIKALPHVNGSPTPPTDETAVENFQTRETDYFQPPLVMYLSTS